MERAVSSNASHLDPLGGQPKERAKRIEVMRQRRFGEAPDSDMNILLFAYDELLKDLEQGLDEMPALLH
jgi:hypothetical protein